MSTNSPFVCEQHLQQLQPFCEALVAALERHGVTPENVPGVLNATVSAECVSCGARATGESLHQLSKTEVAGTDTVKRLRLGYCLHPGCQAYHYRLTFQELAGVDWPAIVSEAQNSCQATPPAPRPKLLSLGDVKRLAIAAVVLVLLALAHQWYFGGRIPILRKPEKFRVDTSPTHGIAQPQ